MASSRLWTRDELIIAMNLYCKLPFGQLDHRTPIIIEVAEKLDRTPSSLSMKLCNLASLDPMQQSRGVKGLRSASKLDRAIWKEFHESWDKLGIESERLFQRLFRRIPLNQSQIDIIKSNQEYLKSHDFRRNFIFGKTEKYTLVKGWIGQSFFRQTVLSSYGFRCCITGNPLPELLVASHILPWSKAAEHRLNPTNGLCLACTHDAAFDKGLITFDENYCLVVSSRIESYLLEETLEANFFSYQGRQLSLPEKFYPNPDFMKFHRENIFIGGAFS